MHLMFFVLFGIYKFLEVVAKDEGKVDFVKQFVLNERKPTHLILNGLCWNPESQIHLIKEMSKLGVSTASSTNAVSRYPDHGLLFITDLDCPKAVEGLDNATTKNLIRSPYRWLVLSEKETKPLTALKKLPLLPDSDWVLAEKGETGFALTELHKASQNHSLQLSIRGYCNDSLMIDYRSHRELFQRRKNLQGYTIMMANVIQDSNSSIYHLDDGLETEYDYVTKVSWWIVKMAAEMLNAKADYKLAFRWGYKSTGWEGMIKMIYSKEVDLGTNCLLFSSRLEVIDHADMLCPAEVRFIFRQPPLSYVSNIFYLPFTEKVWFAVLICTVLSCLGLYFATKFEAKLETSSTQLDGSINDALLLTMSAVSQQGSLLEPKIASGRITVLVQFVTLMALYVAYSANIVVLLQAPSNSIKTLAQLADSKLTLGAHKLDYNYHIMKFYNDSPLIEGVYKRINPAKGKKHYYDIDEGVEKIRQGFFALHAITDFVYRRIAATFLEKEKCDLMEVDLLNVLQPGVPIQKHSPYAELLKVQFKRIRESGIQSALNKRVHVPKPVCADQPAFNSVGLMDIRGSIFMLIFGFVLSIFILVMEIIIHKVFMKKMPAFNNL